MPPCAFILVLSGLVRFIVSGGRITLCTALYESQRFPKTLYPLGLSLVLSEKVCLILAVEPMTKERNTPNKKRIFEVLTANFRNISIARDLVEEAAQAAGLEGRTMYAAQMAVDEAFTNIVEHAYGGECEEKVELECLISPGELTIILRDCGEPFQPEDVPAPDVEAPIEERSEGGLGLFFMRRLMDEVFFTFAGEEGADPDCNVLRMVKRKEPAG